MNRELCKWSSYRQILNQKRDADSIESVGDQLVERGVATRLVIATQHSKISAHHVKTTVLASLGVAVFYARHLGETGRGSCRHFGGSH